MNFNAKLALTFGIQALGILATIISPIIIAQNYGPEAQGFLEFYRSSVLTLFSIGLIGVPQACVYLINSKNGDKSALILFCTLQTIVFVAIICIIFPILYFAGIFQTYGYGEFEIICALVAASSLLMHSLFRAIVLSTSKTYIFNIISITPQVSLLIFYYLYNPDDYRFLAIGMPISGLISALFSAYILRDSIPRIFVFFKEMGKYTRRVILYGRWGYIANVLTLALPTTFYALLRDGGNSDALAGNFSISVLVLGALTTPLTTVAPILLDHWSKTGRDEQVRRSYAKLACISAPLCCVVLAAGLMLVEPITLRVFGADFQPSVTSTLVLLGSVYAVFLAKLSTPALFAMGKPQFIAYGSIIRLMVAIAGLLLLNDITLFEAAILWGIGEYANMLLLGVLLQKMTKWSVREVFGFSYFQSFRK